MPKLVYYKRSIIIDNVNSNNKGLKGQPYLTPMLLLIG